MNILEIMHSGIDMGKIVYIETKNYKNSNLGNKKTK